MNLFKNLEENDYFGGAGQRNDPDPELQPIIIDGFPGDNEEEKLENIKGSEDPPKKEEPPPPKKEEGLYNAVFWITLVIIILLTVVFIVFYFFQKEEVVIPVRIQDFGFQSSKKTLLT